jgi:lysophospholipase L1-like esterase
MDKIALGRAFALRPSPTPGLVYELTPGAEGELWDARVEINAQGFRDREYSLEKPPGVTRIVALGDSITFGNRLAQGVAWPDRLEELFEQEGKAVEVLNLGVGGYDTVQEELFLRERGVQFDPDYVFLCYCINDLSIVSVNLNAIRGLERFQGWMKLSRVAQWILLHLDALRNRDLAGEMLREEARELQAIEVPADPELEALRARLAKVLEANPIVEDVPRPVRVGTTQIRWYLAASRLERVRLALRRIAQLGEQHGFRVVLFVHPYLEEGPRDVMAPAWALVYEMVAHQARSAGLIVMDPYPDMKAAGLSSLRQMKQDAIHPGENGHEVLARSLRRQAAVLPGLE